MRRIKQTFLKQKITEDNWDDYKRVIESITKWCMEDQVYEYPGFIDYIKELKELIISSVSIQTHELFIYLYMYIYIYIYSSHPNVPSYLLQLLIS